MKKRIFLLSCLLILAAAPTAPALDPQASGKLFEKYSASVVAVQYMYDGEIGKHEFVGAGVVVNDQGLVMVPIAMTLNLPVEQMKDFKIILQGDDNAEIPATFEGRDERYDVAYVKASKPIKCTPIKFEDQALKVGDDVESIGIMSKDSGYTPYLNEARVAALLRGPVPQVFISTGGAGTIGSPVFDAKGNAVGLVNSGSPQSLFLNDERTSMNAVLTPSRFFVPSREFLPSLQSPPTAGKPIVVTWLGALTSGIKNDVATALGLAAKSAAQVGEVIPNSPADKAGMKAGDKIVKLDGKALERGDEPDETSAILLRKLRKLPVGTKVKLGVLRAGAKEPVELTVTLEAQPRQVYEVKRWLAEDLGFSVRETVFADTYSKKLPADTAGVVVAFIRKGSSAETARLQMNDIITKVNSTPVKDLEQFTKLYQDFRKEKPHDAVVIEVARLGATDVIRIEPPQ